MTPHNQQRPISRRNFIAQTAGLAAGAAVASSLSSTSAAAKAAEPFRFVHLSDIHLMLERRAREGLAACLDAVGKLDRKPAFIATGGDQCDNLRALNYRDSKDRIELFLKIWNDHTNLPILVAGGAATGLKGNRHLKYAKPTPLANLHLTLLDKAGVKLDKFADSNGKVDELFEPLAI